MGADEINGENYVPGKRRQGQTPGKCVCVFHPQMCFNHKMAMSGPTITFQAAGERKRAAK